MIKKNIKLGVVFDQHVGVGGGYQQAINAALLAASIISLSDKKLKKSSGMIF